MARRRRVKLVRNPEHAGHLPYDEWIPAHAIKFNSDGTTTLMTEGPRSYHNRGRNVADGFVDSAGRFHPIRWATDYDPDRADEEGEYAIHPSGKYYRRHGLKPPKKRKRKAAARKKTAAKKVARRKR